jgi:hypothetical protein
MRIPVLLAAGLMLSISFTAVPLLTQTLGLEQTEFSAEDEAARKPAKIPDDVLALLRQDDRVKSALEDGKIPPGELPIPWFSASAIHLSGPGEPDFIVAGQGPLKGEVVEGFWIFCHTEHGYKLALKAPAHNLVVTETYWNGYREIELSTEVANVLTSVFFRWDGKKYEYVDFQEKSHKLQSR